MYVRMYISVYVKLLNNANCNLRRVIYSLLILQYFANRMQGGRVQLADFCPFIKELLYEGGRTTACERDSNQPTRK